MNTILSPASESEIELAVNTEPRCACALLLDTSGSMEGEPIAELNAGLKKLRGNLIANPLACLRVELLLVSFNDRATVEVDFTSPAKFTPPILTAGGNTALGAAVVKVLDMLTTRRAAYRSAGVAYYRPWMFVITDGKPTDSIIEAARRVKEAEAQRQISFFGIGVKGADMAKLAELSHRSPCPLDGLRFSELFEWLSVSLSSVAVSQPGDQVPLTPPTWSAA